MKARYIIFTAASLLLGSLLSSCQKNWLDVKPASDLVVLTTLSDYQLLMNSGELPFTIGAEEAGSDNYYLSDSFLGSTDVPTLAIYLWAPNGYNSTNDNDWLPAYQAIFECNTALNGLGKIQTNPSNLQEWNQVEGTALFWRAYHYFDLSQTFIKPYNSKTATSDLGIPIRLKADIAQKVGRGTVQQVYEQILNDFNQAVLLLPSTPQLYRTLPTKGAAYAMLARVYLSMGDYQNALSNTNLALNYNSTLLDYNSRAPSNRLSMPLFNSNPEVIVYSKMNPDGILYNFVAVIDSSLFKSYDNNDLRKTLFFSNTQNPSGPAFIGTYDGRNPYNLFSAPAVDELYLIKAECEARAGSTSQAMVDLNTLLSKRWKTGTFTNYTASSSTDALNQILTERRKELVMRGVRWSDLRRLNTDPNYAVTITREYLGQLYKLTPGSNLYVWPIPQDEILNSGIPDNPR